MKPRAFVGYFLGYDSSNIYRIWDPEKETVSGYRDVIFDEHQYYDLYDQADLINEFKENQFGGVQHTFSSTLKVDGEYQPQLFLKLMGLKPPPFRQPLWIITLTWEDLTAMLSNERIIPPVNLIVDIGGHYSYFFSKHRSSMLSSYGCCCHLILNSVIRNLSIK